MKLISMFFVLMMSAEAFAESLTCEVNEFFNSNSELQNFTLQPSKDSHGGWYNLANRHFTDITGFVSLLQKNDQFFAVVSVYSETLKINSSAQYQLVADQQYVQHQLIVPSLNKTLDGISIQCQFSRTQ